MSRYEVRREGGGNVSSFLASEGRIVLELGREANLEMRVQYSGHQGWSNWQWVAADALVIIIFITSYIISSNNLLFRALVTSLTLSFTALSSCWWLGII